jgi:6-phosphogluconolactonase
MESIVNYKEIADFKIFKTDSEIAKYYLGRISQFYDSEHPANIALSGGNAPQKIYNSFTDDDRTGIDWSCINFYWSDERCVPPDHEESNYGNANKSFLSHISIPEKNIFRIKGEADPEEEVERYSCLLNKIPFRNGIPVFDLIFLGVGEDGHTASIFPHQMELLQTKEWIASSKHTISHQDRITFTGKLINNAKEIIFIATGPLKRNVISNLLNNTSVATNYPVYYIRPSNGILRWLVDEEAWPIKKAAGNRQP